MMTPDVEQTQGSEERTCPLDGCFAFASEKLYAPEPPTRSVYLCPSHAREALDAGTATRDAPPLRARVAPLIALDRPLPGSGRLWGPASNPTPIPLKEPVMHKAFSAPPFGATTLAAQILRILARTPRRQTDLAADSGSSSAGINVAAHKLENAGLVTSKKGVYHLTDKGRAWVEADAAHTGGATEAPTVAPASPAEASAAATEASPALSAGQAEALERVKEAETLANEIRRMLGGIPVPGDRPIHELRAYESLVGAKLADKDRQIEELRAVAERYEVLRKTLLLLQDADVEPGWPVVQTDEQLLVGIQGRIDQHAELRAQLIAALTCPGDVSDADLIKTVTHWATTWPGSNPPAPAEVSAPVAPAAHGRRIRRAAELLAEAAAADDRAQELAALAPGGEGLATVPLASAEIYHLVDLHGARADALADEARALL